MATQWVLNKVSDALAPTVSNAVSGAGTFAGGAVNAVGNSINGVGEGINNSIRRYGDGVKDYGNGIMDWTRADGSRAGTASNPLGLSGGVTGGRRQVTSPQIYRATPKKSPSKVMTTTNKTQKKIEGGTPKKALPAPGPNRTAVKKVEGGAPRKALPAPGAKTSTTAAPIKKPVSANPGAMRKTGNAPDKAPAKKVTPVKASTASAPKTNTRPKASGNSTAAANPLGLSF